MPTPDKKFEAVLPDGKKIDIDPSNISEATKLILENLSPEERARIALKIKSKKEGVEEPTKEEGREDDTEKQLLEIARQKKELEEQIKEDEETIKKLKERLEEIESEIKIKETENKDSGDKDDKNRKDSLGTEEAIGSLEKVGSIKYFAIPFPDGSFDSSFSTDTFKKNDSHFKAEKLADGKIAVTFENQKSAIVDAYNSPELILDPIFKIMNERTPEKPTMFTTTKPALYKMVGENLVLQKKGELYYGEAPTE